ncbi:MAG TPA: hypothetical protein VG099_08960 [Gemmataceae bacterium]|nr:hypothetical protein [Gemmataceae bacterium]
MLGTGEYRRGPDLHAAKEPAVCPAPAFQRAAEAAQEIIIRDAQIKSSAVELAKPNVVEFFAHASHIEADSRILGRHACHESFDILRYEAVEIGLPLRPAATEIFENVFHGVEILRYQPRLRNSCNVINDGGSSENSNVTRV